MHMWLQIWIIENHVAMSRLSIIAVLSFISISLLGQNCTENLIEARQSFQNGRFDRIETLLASCMEDYENVADRLEAHELLIKSALMSDQASLADSLMMNLLIDFPLYEARSTELLEFRTLYDSYRIKRNFNLAFHIGLNAPSFSVMQYRSYGSIVQETSGYEPKLGYSIGTELDWNFNERFFASGGLFLQSSKYESEELILDFQNVFIAERISYLKVPLQLGIRFPVKGVEFYGQGGLAGNLLLSSKADLELFGVDPDFPTPLTGLAKKVQGYKLNKQRKSVFWNYLVTLGAQKTYGLYALDISVQYDFGLNNLVQEEERFSDPHLLETYSYVSDDFKLDNIQFRIGVSRHLVKPEKK